MKKYFILLFMVFSHLNNLFAQVPISYGYDASGNRVSKQAVQVQPVGSHGPLSAPMAGAIQSDINGTGETNIKVTSKDKKLTISFFSEINDGKYNINLYTLFGKVARHAESNGGSVTLNMSSLPVGNYILSVNNGERIYEWKIMNKR